MTGVSASASPAANPAARPKRPADEVVDQHRPSATPISACGTSRLQELNPKTRAESACTQSASGGLSTVITPAVSNEP